MAEKQSWAEIGERVRWVRQAKGMSQAGLAEAVGLDRTMLAKIEAGTRRLDALELSRISSALQVPMDLLLTPPPEVISRRVDVTPDGSTTEAAQAPQRLEVELVAWLRDVRQLIELGVLSPRPIIVADRSVSSSDDARAVALWLRDKLNIGDAPIHSLIELCERAGQFMLVTDLPGDGASLVDGDVAVSVVSVQGDPGRRRSTGAHELGHLILGDEYSSDIEVHASRAEREAIVDAFAAELLLPSRVLIAAADGRAMTRDLLVKLAAVHRTSWALAVRQAKHAGVIDSDARRGWMMSNPTRAEFMEAVGWAPQPDLEAVRVPPSYANAVMEAWRRNLVTSARAVELMHGQISEDDLPDRDDREIAL